MTSATETESQRGTPDAQRAALLSSAAQRSRAAGRPERSAAVDGLRGVAVLLVLGLHSHVALFGSGSFGVDMFFVISGFLITNLLVDERRGTVGSRRFYAAFLARRAGRLLPGLFLSVAVVVGWSLLVDKKSPHCTLLSLTHSMNLPGLGGDTCAGPWHVTWSLAAEEQFYVLWPILLFLAIRRLSLRATGMLALISWLLSGAGILVASVWQLLPASQLNYAPWGRSLAVLAGCGLALISPSAAPSRLMKRRITIGCGIAVAVVVVCVAPATAAAVGGQVRVAPLVTAATACILAALVWVPRCRLSRCLSAGLLPAVGRGSYSIYLQHMVPFSLARMLCSDFRLAVCAGLVGTAAMAAVSYWLVERPVRRWSNARVSTWLALGELPTVDISDRRLSGALAYTESSCSE
jgi:peptidoglycan/LPS O-acetylase OafA/YrhL